MDQIKKDRECLHCKHFWDCKGKPAEVKSCVKFERVGDPEEK